MQNKTLYRDPILDLVTETDFCSFGNGSTICRACSHSLRKRSNTGTRKGRVEAAFLSTYKCWTNIF